MLEMQDTEERLRLYDPVHSDCMKNHVLPRLETLIRALGNGSPPDVREKCDRITVTFYSTKKFPIGADVSVFLAHDAKYENLLVLWKVSIIPILIDYEREASATCSLAAPDWVALGVFLDERIVRFMSDYLRIHEPDSPYLQIEKVIDPVCGMTIPRIEAAARVEHDGKPYHFCIEACRDLFLKDPNRYLTTAVR
jgi:YHS domain-containing protein